MRLIDADEFRRELDNYYPFTKEEQSRHGIADIAKSTTLLVLNNTPTIDAVEVVRCKDCTFCSHEYYLDEYDDLYPFYCEIWMKGIDSFDSYCSYGKKDDE